ncbi:hypothetical protein GH714_042265 [Hevea brasiliensis]|uniref:Uncharacterized protein n=1 Tax=Hevea brasiliensis TaxID=3981 RepID=A0A6A6MUR5_HEVBR|nr:hypothetical protein GH714_042265 [Hevea brasiliensis]
MAVKPSNQDASPAFVETVEEIMKLYRSLPSRPSIEEVEAAMSVIETVNGEEKQRLEEISKQDCPRDVPEELFSVLQQFRRTMVEFQSNEQRKEALHLVEVDKMFGTFDGLIQRASLLVSGDTQKEEVVAFSDSDEKIGRESLVNEENLINRREDGELEKDGFKGLVKSSSTKATFFSEQSSTYIEFNLRLKVVTWDSFVIPSLYGRDFGVFLGEGEPEKLSLMMVAAIIENSAKLKL